MSSTSSALLARLNPSPMTPSCMPSVPSTLYLVSHIYSFFANSSFRTNATWGLQRITQTAALSNQNAAGTSFTYTYNDAAGAGVDVYVVDTGILTTHKEFGGRAKWGISYVGTSTDGHGHGTHVAGTIGSFTYGVSKKASLIAVQVLSASGSGSTSGM